MACTVPNTVCEGMNREHVCVTFVNRSGYDIHSLVLARSSGDPFHWPGRYEIGPLDEGATTSFMFPNSGENSYRIAAVLEQGDTLRSKSSYVEGGYMMTEVIDPKDIRTQYNLSYPPTIDHRP